jgi:hypothetical protein
MTIQKYRTNELQRNSFLFYFSKRNFIKGERSPEYTESIQKDTKTERAKKTRIKKKNTNKDPTTVENPKHPKKYAKTLYNITSQQPSCFFPE